MSFLVARRALLPLAALLVWGCSCEERTPRRAGAVGSDPGTAAHEPDPGLRPSSLDPTPREPGPAREETRSRVARAREEAEQLARTLLDSGVDRREVASMLDIRGYRLFRRRYFRSALAWFERAARADATFEPGLFHGARAACLAGDLERARQLLLALQHRDTPMSRARLRLAATHPDFAALRRALPDAGG